MSGRRARIAATVVLRKQIRVLSPDHHQRHAAKRVERGPQRRQRLVEVDAVHGPGELHVVGRHEPLPRDLEAAAREGEPFVVGELGEVLAEQPAKISAPSSKLFGCGSLPT